jgi:hypothetical protein
MTWRERIKERIAQKERDIDHFKADTDLPEKWRDDTILALNLMIDNHVLHGMALDLCIHLALDSSHGLSDEELEQLGCVDRRWQEYSL